MQKTVNTQRTDGGSVTVALPRSGPVRYELIGPDGEQEGTYFTLRDARVAAKYLWPDQEQDPDRTGKGWDIQVYGS